MSSIDTNLATEEISLAKELSIVAVIKGTGWQRVERLSLSAGNQFNIGRAWNNDIVVDDNYIDPEHLSVSLTPQGDLIIKDLDSKNGSRLGKKLLSSSSKYQFGDVIQLGDSEITFHNGDAGVAPALAFDSAHKFARKYKSVVAISLATIAAFSLVILSRYFQSIEEVNSANILKTIFGFGVATFIWSLLAGFIGKLFRNETYFSLHWMLVCLIVIAVSVLSYFVDFFKFNTQSSLFSVIVEYLIYGILFAVFVYGTLSFATRFEKTKKIIFSVALALIPILVTIVEPMLKEERDLWAYSADSGSLTLMPVFKVAKGVSYDEHLEYVDDLFDELDSELIHSKQ